MVQKYWFKTLIGLENCEFKALLGSNKLWLKKHFRSKKILPKRIVCSIKNLCGTKFCFWKLWIQRNLGSQIFLGIKTFGLESIFSPQKFCVWEWVTNNLCDKNIGSKKVLGPKPLWVKKDFGSKKMMGPNKYWIQKNVVSKKCCVKTTKLLVQ